MATSTLDLWEYIFYAGMAFFALMFGLVFLIEKIRNVRDGLPLRDEMQKKVIYKSGFLGFIAAIISIAIMAILNIYYPGLTVNMVFGLIFLISCSVVLLSYLFMYKRGATE
ncbi:MAG: hypothetical protein FK733_08175 [Asgard group archaeon]|nr:hypothetical protein [Asgard group archaeon]